jgi:hypothetical protein
MFGDFLGESSRCSDTVNFRHLYGTAPLDDPNQNRDDGQYKEDVENPPRVYELTIPNSHRIRSRTAIVQSISVFSAGRVNSDSAP